jgi:hypothetical protein
MNTYLIVYKLIDWGKVTEGEMEIQAENANQAGFKAEKILKERYPDLLVEIEVY